LKKAPEKAKPAGNWKPELKIENREAIAVITETSNMGEGS